MLPVSHPILLSSNTCSSGGSLNVTCSLLPEGMSGKCLRGLSLASASSISDSRSCNTSFCIKLKSIYFLITSNLLPKVFIEALNLKLVSMSSMLTYKTYRFVVEQDYQYPTAATNFVTCSLVPQPLIYVNNHKFYN